ncbi:MAG: peptidylprolyl isomerase [Pseudomonadota bacterium]
MRKKYTKNHSVFLKNFVRKTIFSSIIFFISTATSIAFSEEMLDRTIVIIEDEIITEREFLEHYNVTMQSMTIPKENLPPEEILQKQILERLVVDRLQLIEAKKRGIRIDDFALNNSMRNIAAGNRLDLDGFREMLFNKGIIYAQFREKIRNEMAIEQLKNRAIISNINITAQEIDDFIKHKSELLTQEEKYHLLHILIALNEAAKPHEIQKASEEAKGIMKKIKEGVDFSELAVTHSDGQTALEGGDIGWRSLREMPSIFVNPVQNMAVGEVSPIIKNPSGFHIIKLAEIQGGLNSIVKQTHARHILIQPNALIDDNEAMTRLETIKQRIEGGEKFSDLAKATSDDKGSAAEGGDLGWRSPGQLIPIFENEMNRLEFGEISAPFRSQYGFHIVQVLDRRERDNTEESLRLRAENYLKSQKAQQEIESWLRRLRNESYVEYLFLQDNPSG